MPTLETQAPPLTCAGLFIEQTSSYKTAAYTWRYLYEKWNKETRLVTHTGSRIKIARQKESAREENCKDSEADRGRDTAKSIKHRALVGFPRLISKQIEPSGLVAMPTPATQPRHSRARGFSYAICLISSFGKLFATHLYPQRCGTQEGYPSARQNGSPVFYYQRHDYVFLCRQ